MSHLAPLSRVPLAARAGGAGSSAPRSPRPARLRPDPLPDPAPPRYPDPPHPTPAGPAAIRPPQPHRHPARTSVLTVNMVNINPKIPYATLTSYAPHLIVPADHKAHSYHAG